VAGWNSFEHFSKVEVETNPEKSQPRFCRFDLKSLSLEKLSKEVSDQFEGFH
jgi:hypothetical protein